MRVLLLALFLASPVWGAEKLTVDIFSCLNEQVSLLKLLEERRNPDTYRYVLGEIMEDLKTVTRFKIDGSEGWLKIEGVGSFDSALVRNIYYGDSLGMEDGIDPHNAPTIIIFDGEELIIKNYSNRDVDTERYVCGESDYWEDEVEEYQQYLWNESSKKAN